MKELVVILEGIGAQNVKTYVQSGNVVFQFAKPDFSRLSKKITAAIKKRRGFEPHVLILGLDAIEKAIAQNPFPEAEAEPSSLHLGFLAWEPKSPALDKLNNLKKESERFRLVGSVFYLHAPEGVGRSKLAASSERALGVPMTDRNWKYAFGTKTADFHVCSKCGVVPVVTSSIDDQTYAVVSVNAMNDVDQLLLKCASASFDGEETADRLARRKRGWIPEVLFRRL